MENKEVSSGLDGTAAQQPKRVGDPINDAIYGKHGIKQGIEACFNSEFYGSAALSRMILSSHPS